MRLHRTLPQGSSLEFTAFFMNRSLASRMLMLGLPLLALVLLIIFTATGSSIEAILDRAIARNAQLQSQAMSLALEQALEETRNQLLILAAGSMDQKDMANRLKFRAKAGGLRYRELAFEGLAPDNRYLLVNTGGDIINVPMRQALASPTGSMSPPHSAERSPGSSSRWTLARQLGQWLRCRVPASAGPTGQPQDRQVKTSPQGSLRKSAGRRLGFCGMR